MSEQKFKRAEWLEQWESERHWSRVVSEGLAAVRREVINGNAFLGRNAPARSTILQGELPIVMRVPGEDGLYRKSATGHNLEEFAARIATAAAPPLYTTGLDKLAVLTVGGGIDVAGWGQKTSEIFDPSDPCRGADHVEVTAGELLRLALMDGIAVAVVDVPDDGGDPMILPTSISAVLEVKWGRSRETNMIALAVGPHGQEESSVDVYRRVNGKVQLEHFEKIDEKGAEYQSVGQRTLAGMTSIPAFAFQIGSQEKWCCRPPFAALAEQQARVIDLRSLYERQAANAEGSILAIIGGNIADLNNPGPGDDGRIPGAQPHIGAGSIIQLQSEQAKVIKLQSSGVGLDHYGILCEKMIEDIKDTFAAYGARIQAVDQAPNADPETATKVRADQSAGSKWIRAVGVQLTNTLRCCGVVTAQYHGETTGGTVEIRTDRAEAVARGELRADDVGEEQVKVSGGRKRTSRGVNRPINPPGNRMEEGS